MSYVILQSSLADQVGDSLKQRILSGDLAAGMMIPEEQLAAQFGVSRTPIREAIRRLAEYGLVVLKPRSHAQVRQISEKEASDIARVRTHLEQLAIDCMTIESVNSHIEKLARLAAECQYYLGLGDRAMLFVRDSQFHLELARCAENEALYDLYERLDAQVQLVRVAQNLPHPLLGIIINQHSTLLHLLRTGEMAQAKSLMHKHVMHEIDVEET